MPHYLVVVASRDTNTVARPQNLYLLAGSQLPPAVVAELTAMLLHDPVMQQAAWYSLDTIALADEPHVVPAASVIAEVAYRPGVTDNEGESLRAGAQRLGIGALEQARALRRYVLASADDVAGYANDIVQTALVYQPGSDPAKRVAFYRQLLTPPADVTAQIALVPLRNANDGELERISREGVLALSLDEMQAIRRYFVAVERDPTDGELETIAQTWSEHCSHKTFKARVRYRLAEQGTGDRKQETREQRTGAADRSLSLSKGPAAQYSELYPAYQMLQQDCEIDSLIRTFLVAPTNSILAERPGWVHSAFVDNAGIVAFTDEFDISFKVETHNHPSALEPFGGANTGVGGVIRDVLGVSARPIANTDVLCFGPPNLAANALPTGVLHPRQVYAGVVAGVRDYGNKLGIPTVNGAVLFDPGYVANPLVYCGTLGIAPHGSHPHNLQSGDAVVVLGGRTGRDGIHGATFSSIELSDTTADDVGSAVQIGDPITEKKLLDVLLQARDQRLYSAITDCGAGGLSSAVNEIGAETGVVVELAHVALKYAGLQPWEIWLSEAQERMVLAVPQQNLDTFLALCAAEDVTATAIGAFTADQTLRVTYHGETVVELAMPFLHDGRPQRVLDATWTERTSSLADETTTEASDGSLTDILLALLAHPNIASKERIVRTYDHEVGGATVIKPLVGAVSAGPGDAAVLQPLRSTNAGVALGCGINPRYGVLDPYWMALACVDEALRNVVAVGGDPERTTILDNFCWGDPRQPDRMAGLVRAAAGCHDAALAFGTPFISGKDSLNNEYRDGNGTRVAIPPTLLISALAHVPDVLRCVTMDLKEPGNSVYLVGDTRDEFGGSHAALLFDQRLPRTPRQVPRVDLAAARRTFRALHAAISQGLVRACHDLSEGGLAVAAAEMVIAGEWGLALHAPDAGDPLVWLFAETPSRFLVEVTPDAHPTFEAALNGVAHTHVGTVITAPELTIDGPVAIQAPLAILKQAWQSGIEDIAL